MKEPTTTERLQRWFNSMTGGDWQHTYGIEISNVDNPGWSVRVDLVDTYLHDRDFDVTHVQRTDENDWVICKVDEGVFQGYGGPCNLDEILLIFLDWAELDNS